MSAPSEAQALKRLEAVARSEAIQLVEVTIAKDLLTGRLKTPPPELPPNVKLP
jgi:hypothetical protein